MTLDARLRACLVGLALSSLWAPQVAAQRKVLFDASHRESAGNADWVIDADLFDLGQPHFPCGPSDFENESRAQRFPTPDASAIVATTGETYWTGGISAFAVDLVQAGFAVESLPVGASISYGDGGNPQDLANYDVLILPEPNQPFSPLETSAIRDFVAAGGGLLLIADHQTSDRDCDGEDSPHIGNDLMGVVIAGGSIADYGLFGIAFNVQEIAGQTTADWWFDDAVDDNVTASPTDPIVHGPYGDGSGGLGLFGATSMSIDPATNPTVTAHVWRTNAAGQGNTRVTFATGEYLLGRIACIGDSSPADDGSGDPGDNLYLGWDRASGGVANREIHLNAVEWLAGPDTTPPAITSGPLASPGDCSAEITWSTDEPSDSRVDYGPTAAYGSSESDPAPTLDHRVSLRNLSPGQVYHFSVASTDLAGNVSSPVADASFLTGSVAPPTITAGPTLAGVSGTAATLLWSTDEPADSLVEYGSTNAYGMSAADAALTTSHGITLTGLAPGTSYHFRTTSFDGCGNGPTRSADGAFTTAPPQIDISGWKLLQFDSAQSYTFPLGTTLPSAGYLVLGRDANQAAFEIEWGPLPPGTVFVDSGGVFPLINGGESFRLEDGLGGTVDGTTIAMSSGTSIERNHPGDPPGSPGSWTVRAAAAGTPGSGAGTPTGVGVVINEASDASDFQHEFVELHHDSTPAAPDTTPPGTVADLSAEPRSSATVRLAWTAPGDDGATGTATSYDVRHAAIPILSAAGFAAATPLGGEPPPQVAGTAEHWDVSGLDPDTAYYFALTATDEAGHTSAPSNSAGGTTGLPGSSTPPTADHLVIGEIRVRGSVDQNDEFIELYNPGASAVGLAGSSVQYKSASGTTYSRFDLPSASIPAGGYFLLARPEYGGGVAPDATWNNFLMGASGGHVFLVASTTSLSSCTAAMIVDKIGYGSADCPEGAAAPTHGAGQSLERAPGAADPLCGNGTDTDDNDQDFGVLAPPDPRNSSGPSEVPCRGLGNVGSSLFYPDSSEFVWAAALGAADYKIRRSTSADFMQIHPVPDDTHVLAQVVATRHADADEPASGAAFYYFVNATDGAAVESAD